MNSKQYVADAIRTESVPTEIKINQVSLHALMTMMIEMAEVANQFKRKLFYGKDINILDLSTALGSIDNCCRFLEIEAAAGQLDVILSKSKVQLNMPNRPKSAPIPILGNLDIRLLHAAIGTFTESGEMIEALREQYETGKLDKVNFAEEIGDVSWYQAIAVDALGADFDSIRETNIAKLRARFPDKFNAEKALNRDLTAERAILEGESV